MYGILRGNWAEKLVEHIISCWFALYLMDCSLGNNAITKSYWSSKQNSPFQHCKYTVSCLYLFQLCYYERPTTIYIVHIKKNIYTCALGIGIF